MTRENSTRRTRELCNRGAHSRLEAPRSVAVVTKSLFVKGGILGMPNPLNLGASGDGLGLLPSAGPADLQQVGADFKLVRFMVSGAHRSIRWSKNRHLEDRRDRIAILYPDFGHQVLHKSLPFRQRGLYHRWSPPCRVSLKGSDSG